MTAAASDGWETLPVRDGVFLAGHPVARLPSCP